MLKYNERAYGVFEIDSEYVVKLHTELNIKGNKPSWSVTKTHFTLHKGYLWCPVITSGNLIVADAIYSAVYYTHKYNRPIFVTKDTEALFKVNMADLFKSVAYETGTCITDDLQEELLKLEKYYFTGDTPC